jgi:hypothetical protein
LIVDPGVAVVEPSVLVTARSARSATVSVSVAALLPGLGSVEPPGTATVAVFEIEPEAEGLTVPLTRYVALEPDASVSVSAIELPDPEAVEQEPGPATEHVQLTPLIEAGTVSTKAAPVTSLGPLFETVTV